LFSNCARYGEISKQALKFAGLIIRKPPVKIQNREPLAPCSVFGGGVGFKTEHRHRGMKLGIAPHFPDDWGRQLAAGGA